jgi:hypothetical protein
MRYFPRASIEDDAAAARALLDEPTRDRVLRYSGTWDEPEVRYLRSGEVVVVQRVKSYSYDAGGYEMKELARWTR